LFLLQQYLNSEQGDILKCNEEKYTIWKFEGDVCTLLSTSDKIDLPVELLPRFQHIRGPLSVASNNMPIVHIGLSVTTDETSGNTTKRWNHFENIFVRISNLPVATDGYRLVASANNITWFELSEAAFREFEVGGKMEKGFKVWNAHERCWYWAVATIHVIICDNPRALEICSMVNPSGLRNCRYCYANRLTQILAKNQRARSKALTMETIQQMSTMIPSHATVFRISTGIKLQVFPNVFFKMSLDPHYATPPEILHTILLGVIKHVVTVNLVECQKENSKIIH
jgi:hypothetical protein